MKKILFASILALSSVASFAQENHAFPKKLTDLNTKTNIRTSKGLVTDTLMLLNSVPGPIVLRLCVTRQSSIDASHLHAKLNDGTVLVDEYLNAHDRNANKKDDFVMCKDTEFSSYEALDGKSIRITAFNGVDRKFYVEAFPKNRPSLSWPVLVKNSRETLDDASYVNIDIYNSK